jgi:hypothetical protein
MNPKLNTIDRVSFIRLFKILNCHSAGFSCFPSVVLKKNESHIKPIRT